MANNLSPKISFVRLSTCIQRYIFPQITRGWCSNSDDVKNKKPEVDPITAPEDPEEPTTCCMSGCANCVWIQYAEIMAARYKDGGVKARVAINKINDPMMKAFLMTELKVLEK